ncbi:MAG: hypothetical protein FIB01_03835 [Gemmatimonadetes bacterium]|nr:hypothetical protein [Gemmatimonadota bacterium]
MRKHTLIVAALALMPAALSGQEPWSWTGAVSPGKSIEIKGVNGDISAAFASGTQVRLSARKTARRSDVESVKLEVVELTPAGSPSARSIPHPPASRKTNVSPVTAAATACGTTTSPWTSPWRCRAA